MKLLKYALFSAALALGGIALFSPTPSHAQIYRACTETAGCNMSGYIFSTAGGIPAVTGTGTPTIATGSSSTEGVVTAGASATSVIITFGTAYSQVPFCVASSYTQLAAFAYTVTATAITITQTATSGNKIYYRCAPSVPGG